MDVNIGGAVRTVLSSDTAASLFVKNYAFGPVKSCELHAVTANEHYIITTGSQRFVLCIHNHHKTWLTTPGTQPTPAFECALLNHLSSHGLPVANALATQNGEPFCTVQAPEGLRYVTLYNYAEGQNAYPPSEQQARQMGRQLARMHHCLDNGEFNYDAFQPIVYDAERLLRQPVLRICKFLGEQRQDVQTYLQGEAELLQAALEQLPQNVQSFGPIYGGMTGVNHHVQPSGSQPEQDNTAPIMHFGFGQTGLGFRVYDMALFLWHAKLYQIPENIAQAFQSGYLAERPLSEAELALVPQLIKTKMIYTMGYHAAFAQWIGRSFMDDAYWARHITPMQQW